MLKLNREQNTTILISSHILDELFHLATRFGFIDEGRMVREVTKHEFMSETAQYIRIETTDMPALTRALTSIQVTNFKVVAANELHVFDEKRPISTLNQALVTAGVPITGIGQAGQNLEDYFKTLLSDQREAVRKMLNLMRADFYRLRHSRSLLIWEVFILGFTIFTTVNWSRSNHLTGWLGVQLINNNGSLFVWLLPLILLTIGHDFSQQLLKDTLTMGISRRRYFLSKMVTTVVAIALQLLAIQLIAFIGGIIAGGLGQMSWGDWLAQWLVYVLLVTTEITIITMILYWSNSTTAAIAMGFLVLLVIAILHIQFVNLQILHYVDWLISTSQLKTVHLNSLGNITKPVIGAVILVIGGGILNDWRFEKMSL